MEKENKRQGIQEQGNGKGRKFVNEVTKKSNNLVSKIWNLRKDRRY